MKRLSVPATVAAALLLATPVFAGGRYPAPTRDPHLTLAKPTHVVAPQGLPASFKNTIVQVSIQLDANGTPQRVAPVGRMPAEVAERLLPAVSQWRFSPVYENGHAVSARVILPIELVEES